MERRTDQKMEGWTDGQGQNNIPPPIAGENYTEIRENNNFIDLITQWFHVKHQNCNYLRNDDLK